MLLILAKGESMCLVIGVKKEKTEKRSNKPEVPCKVLQLEFFALRAEIWTLCRTQRRYRPRGNP